MATVNVNRWSIDIGPEPKGGSRRRRVVEIYYRGDAGPVFVCSALYSVELAKLAEVRFALACTENDRAKIRSQLHTMESAIAEKLWEEAPENPKNAGGPDPFDDAFPDFEELWEIFGMGPRGQTHKRAREVWENARRRAAGHAAGEAPPRDREPPPASSRFHVSDDDLATLGVQRGASWSEVSRAFRRKARAAHPDVGGDPAQMVRINQAYQRVRQAMGQ